MKGRRFNLGYILLMALLVSSASAISVSFGEVNAAEGREAIGNEACLECHGDEALYHVSQDGKVVSLWIDEEKWSGDVHNQKGVRCVQCHTEAETTVHPKQGFERVNCAMDCHLQGFQNHINEYAQCQKNTHAVGIENEAGEIIFCSDCHGKHTIRPVGDPLSSMGGDNLAFTCLRCHPDVVGQPGILNRIIGYRMDHHEKVNLCERNDEHQCLNCHYREASHTGANREKHSCEYCHAMGNNQQGIAFSPIHLKSSLREQPATALAKLIYVLFMIGVVVSLMYFSIGYVVKVSRSKEKIEALVDKFPLLFKRGEG